MELNGLIAFTVILGTIGMCGVYVWTRHRPYIPILVYTEQMQKVICSSETSPPTETSSKTRYWKFTLYLNRDG